MLRHCSALDVLENPENPRLESRIPRKYRLLRTLFPIGVWFYRSPEFHHRHLCYALNISESLKICKVGHENVRECTSWKKRVNFKRKSQTTDDIGGGATFFELHKIYFEFLSSDISFLEFGCNARNIIIWLALPVTVRSKAVLVSRAVQVNLSLDLMVANLCSTKRLFSNDYRPFQHRISLFR